MSYENSTACRVLATHCAVCARPLVDAKSVELGVGPDCRRRLGMDREMPEEAREEANRLVHAIALAVSTSSDRGRVIAAGGAVAGSLARLRELGFDLLAQKLEERWCPVRVVEEDGGRWLAVKAPYDENSVAGARGIPGRRWDGERKLNLFPAVQRALVWRWLGRHYAGMAGVGPRGAFVVGQLSAPGASV